MTMKKSLWFLTLLCLIACERQPAIPAEPIGQQASKTIPLENALQELEDLLGDLYGNTKAHKDFSVEVFGGTSTKGAESIPDTLLYLVNFADNEGFSVLAAQEQIRTPVFCITESGNLSEQNLADALDYILTQTSATKSDSEASSDEEFSAVGEACVPILIVSSALAQMDGEYRDDDLEDETKADRYETVEKYGPYLYTKWHQDSPFNDFRSDNAPAGCVAVATAQILQFNKVGNPDNMNFNWALLETVSNAATYSVPLDSIPPAAKSEASRFLQYVGRKKNCYIRYGESSGGYADGATRTLKNWGYTARKYYGFEKADKNRVIAQLKRGQPVYVDGSGGGSGHAWVVDGLFVRKVFDDSDNYLRTENLFHINWGWGSISDGYYNQGVFNTTRRIDIDSGYDSGAGGAVYNYTWNYRTIIHSL